MGLELQDVDVSNVSMSALSMSGLEVPGYFGISGFIMFI